MGKNLFILLILLFAVFSGCAENKSAKELDNIYQITKAEDTTANGDLNFCGDTSVLCNYGEGDCDNDAECSNGLVCGDNIGAKFGLNNNVDICINSNCTNEIQDLEELDVDCGIIAGCIPCGDTDTGPAIDTGTDVIVDTGTGTDVFDTDTGTGVDTGTGEYERPFGCPTQSLHYEFCTPECLCKANEGDCDNDEDCLPGFYCDDQPGGGDLCQSLNPDTDTDTGELDTGTGEPIDTGTVDTDTADTNTASSDTDSQTAVISDTDFFTVIILPDTQNYTAWNPSIFEAQTQWVADNKDNLNIQFVVHVGDVVGSNTSDQWTTGSDAMQILDNALIPYTIGYGNHDRVNNTRDTTLMNVDFPLSRFSLMNTYGGSSDNITSDNTYHKLDVLGYKLLIFGVELGPGDDILTWMKEIIDANTDYNVMIATHSYLNPDGQRAADGDSKNPRFYLGDNDYNDGQLMWDELIKLESAIKFVVCGHVGVDNGAARLASTTNTGTVVHEMLSNYQYAASTHEGALRILKFYPNNNILEASTYSPTRDEYFIDTDNQFTINL